MCLTWRANRLITTPLALLEPVRVDDHQEFITSGIVYFAVGALIHRTNLVCPTLEFAQHLSVSQQPGAFFYRFTLLILEVDVVAHVSRRILCCVEIDEGASTRMEHVLLQYRGSSSVSVIV